jgi:16S rRNA (guanine(527)-N(7))-methyltransferase RsmG
MDSAAGLRELVGRAGIAAEAGDRLLRYLRLLEKWNARMNLTSRTDWEGLGPMFEEAVWAAGQYGAAAHRHLDIGSGAGFPALPMAALRPEMRLDLLEPRARRAVFLEIAARELGLREARVHEARLGDYLDGDLEARGWDRVSWKAVRIGAGDVEVLAERAVPHAEFWLFHGRQLPVEDEEAWRRRMRLSRTAEFPGKRGWCLSVFQG